MYFVFCLPVWATQGLSWVFLINFDIFVNSFWPTCHLSDTRLSDTLLSDTRLSDKNVLFVLSFLNLKCSVFVDPYIFLLPAAKHRTQKLLHKKWFILQA